MPYLCHSISVVVENDNHIAPGVLVTENEIGEDPLSSSPFNFHSLEVVDRVSETQLQVGENYSSFGMEGDVPERCSVEKTELDVMRRLLRDEHTITSIPTPIPNANEDREAYQHISVCQIAKTNSFALPSGTHRGTTSVQCTHKTDEPKTKPVEIQNKKTNVMPEHEKLLYMMDEDNRLNTFVNWFYHCSVVSSRDLAKAGLYYIGPGDRVRSAYCLNKLERVVWKRTRKQPSVIARNYFKIVCSQNLFRSKIHRSAIMQDFR